MRIRKQQAAAIGILAMSIAAAYAQQSVSLPTRVISADMQQVRGPRNEAWRKCVGSAHAGMELQAANMQQLAIEHRELGFEFVRFHGLLTDDMGVYREVDGKPMYDFSKVDKLYDLILSAGVKPFVELGFMPDALASGNQRQFFWNANVTPPKELNKWAALVQALVEHLQQRYGHDQVASWYFEVWNEPNYPGFWPNADQKSYFDLYDATAPVVKRFSQDFRVGGPATAGAGWVPEFIAHVAEHNVPVDFISTHTYAVSQGFLDADGQADLVLSSDAGAISDDVKRVHQQIAASARPDLPLEITEWSSSYSSRDPVHDSYTNAAFVLEKLKQTEGQADSMSYWTYSDLFEENGPGPAAFHGGFGLMTRDSLRKATYFSYKYLNELGGTELASTDQRSWVARSSYGAQALVWDFTPMQQTEGNKAFYRKLHPAAAAAPVELRLTHVLPGSYIVTLHRIGFQANDAYSRYIQMGLPKDLSAAQLAELQQLTADQPEMTENVTIGPDGLFKTKISMRQNDIVLATLARR